MEILFFSLSSFGFREALLSDLGIRLCSLPDYFTVPGVWFLAVFLENQRSSRSGRLLVETEEANSCWF
jgi:hypothetical protein